MSHATGWQTVVPSEVPKSPPKVDLQKEPQPDGEKVAATAAQSSPEPPNSELPIHASREPGVNKNSGEAVRADPSNPDGLLSQWLTESLRTVREKSVETSLDGNELLVQNQESATTDPASGAAAIVATAGTDSKSNASESDRPEEDTDHSPEVAESELAGKQPEPPSGETSNVVPPSSVAQRITDRSFADSAFAARVNVPPTSSNREVAAVGAADSLEAGVNKNGADAVKAAPSNPA